jgi:hypothetical protein
MAAKQNKKPAAAATWPQDPPPRSELEIYRLLAPNASVRVSPLCLGAMNFGEAWYVTHRWFSSYKFWRFMSKLSEGNLSSVNAINKPLLKFSIISTLKAVTSLIPRTIIKSSNLSSGLENGCNLGKIEMISFWQPSLPANTDYMILIVRSRPIILATRSKACISRLNRA